jgi:hypothetical protein
MGRVWGMKSTAEKFAALKGKTIQNITADQINELSDSARDFTLYFTDGTSQTFYSGKLDEYTTAIYID